MAQSPSQPDPKQKTAPPVPTGAVDADAVVRRAENLAGRPAAEAYLQAAASYRRRPDMVATMHCLERALGALSEIIETPPAAKLGAEIEFQLGILCEEDLGRFEDALVHYQRAFKLRPDHLEPLRRGRLIYQSYGDLDMVARLIDLHLANLVASDTQTGVALSLELGQLKLRLHDAAGAVEALRGALRMHNESGTGEDLPEALLTTLAEAYVSPEYQPGISEKDQARRHASEIYLTLAKRYLDPKALLSPDQPATANQGKLDPKEAEKKAAGLLHKALDADARNVTAAALLEAVYQRLPKDQRVQELIKLYKSGARVSRRGPKLLKLYEESGGVMDYGAIVDACRTGLDAVTSVEEWRETRDTLKATLEKSGDQLGLAAIREEDASEAALPEDRAELLMQAADLYLKSGDQERNIACLKQAFHELPLHVDAFRKLSDYYKSRRDFVGLAVIQEAKMAAMFETAKIDLPSYAKQLEELGELYEKKMQDVASAAAVWRRIDELCPSPRSQSERRRLAQRLSRIGQQVREHQLELDRLPESEVQQRVELLRRLGQLFRELHETKHASEVYEDLLRLTTDLPAIKILIELREQSGDVSGQLDLLRQQVGMVTDRAERLSILRRMMTLCDQRMLQRGESLDAQDALGMTSWVCRSLLAELPSDRDALKRLSETLALQGNKTELVDVLEAYLKVAPTPREKLTLHKQIARAAEDSADLARAASHLERAVRISPPGVESEEVLCELSRLYSEQGRKDLAIQTIELCIKQSQKAGPEVYRLLGRIALQSEDPAHFERSIKAFQELQNRLPDDIEALSGLQKLYHLQNNWSELKAVLQRGLALADPPLPPKERITVALELSEVVSEHDHDLKKAISIIEAAQAETPIVDPRIHRRLRVLHEELGNWSQAARSAERELLLTEDISARMERAIEIARMWQERAKDRDQALLAYERVVQIAPELSVDAPDAGAIRAVTMQALEAMGQIYVAAAAWKDVLRIGRQRLGVVAEQGDAVQAAMILLDLALVQEEKLKNPKEGFALRRQALGLAPHVVALDELHAVAAKHGMWQELAEVHVELVEQALADKVELPLESLLTAVSVLEKQLRQTSSAFKLLKRVLPQTLDVAIDASSDGTPYARVLQELRRLVLEAVTGRRSDDNALMEGVSMMRDLLQLHRGLVDELCRAEGAEGEQMAARMHRLLGAAATVREQANADYSGALGDRLHAFTVGGERDHSVEPDLDAVFADTVHEIHRLAPLANQVKEAISVDMRRLERATSDLRRQNIACEHAAWLDDHGGDPQRSLKAALKALTLCSEGSDAQAEMRGRLTRLAQRMGLLAWDEISRAERALVAHQPKLLRHRMLYLASLWQHGAADSGRAMDSAGQAYRLCFFPGGMPTAGKGGPPLSELVIAHPDPELVQEQAEVRAVLDRIASTAANESDGNGKLVALLDNLSNQLIEAGALHLAAAVQIDAGQVDERRGRMAQAERRYLEAAKQPQFSESASVSLLRVYRQQRRLGDVAALLEKRRAIVPASQQHALLLDLAEIYRETNKHQLALNALSQAIALNDGEAAPYVTQAKIYESQKMWLRAVEAYQSAAQRANSDEKSLSCLLAAAQLTEKKLDEADEALGLYRRALERAYGAVKTAYDHGEVPGKDSTLLSERNVAWASAERLLRAGKDLREVDALLVERLAHTPSAAIDDRVSLLEQRRDLLLALHEKRKDPGELPSALIATIQELARLKPRDDLMLSKQQTLAQSLSLPGLVRDLTRLRAEAAEANGVETKVQVERWVETSQRCLEVDDVAGGEAAVQRALQLDGASLLAKRAQVALYAQLRRHAEWVDALLSLSASVPELEESVRTQLQAAEAARLSLGDVERARSLIQEALSRSQAKRSTAGQAESLLSLFALERDAGNSAAAMDLARQAIRTGGVPRDRQAELYEQLGVAAAERGATAEAKQNFESALSLRPGLRVATLGLLSLLGTNAPTARVLELSSLALSQGQGQSLPAAGEAALCRYQGRARLALGQKQPALESLRLAESLSTGTIADKLELGELAYELGDYPVAATQLGELSVYVESLEQLPPPLTKAKLAGALEHAATAAAQTQRAAEAGRLWQAALRAQPEHAEALEHYLTHLLTAGSPEDASAATELLVERAQQASATHDLATALHAYTRAADLAKDRLLDVPRAQGLLQAAYALLPKAPNDPDSDEKSGKVQVPSALSALYRGIVERNLDCAQKTGDKPQLQAYAHELATLVTQPAEKSRYFGQAAQAALANRDTDAGKALLLQALRYQPGQLDLLDQLVPLCDDSEAVALLSAMLPVSQSSVFVAPDSSQEEPQSQIEKRVHLWRVLAGAQVRLGEPDAAASTYDLAIAAASALSPDVTHELRHAALQVIHDDSHPRLAEHLRALLEVSPLDEQLLLRWQQLAVYQGQAGTARRIAQVLYYLADPSLASNPEGRPPALPPIPTNVRLEDADHLRFAEPSARSLGDVFAALWDGITGLKAPALDAFGAAGNDRVLPTESSADEAARAFAVATRVLGNQKSSLYRVGWQQFALPRVVGKLPGSLVISPALGRLSPGEIQFILARAVQGLRPEYILALCMPAAELTHLLGLAVRGFHPRHAKIPQEEVTAWKRELPYRAVKRLGEVFRDLGEVSFSTVEWRRAVRRATQRAALLICGDLIAAVQVVAGIDLSLAQGTGNAADDALRPHLRLDTLSRPIDIEAEAEADIDDLCRFYLDPQHAALFDRLHPLSS